LCDAGKTSGAIPRLQEFQLRSDVAAQKYESVSHISPMHWLAGADAESLSVS
jgi:hypothetical protein